MWYDEQLSSSGPLTAP